MPLDSYMQAGLGGLQGAGQSLIPRMPGAQQDLLTQILPLLLAALGVGGPARFAGGGVVTQPTVAMLGERGPEAVVPLSRQAMRARQQWGDILNRQQPGADVFGRQLARYRAAGSKLNELSPPAPPAPPPSGYGPDSAFMRNLQDIAAHNYYLGGPSSLAGGIQQPSELRATNLTDPIWSVLGTLFGGGR